MAPWQLEWEGFGSHQQEVIWSTTLDLSHRQDVLCAVSSRIGAPHQVVCQLALHIPLVTLCTILSNRTCLRYLMDYHEFFKYVYICHHPTMSNCRTLLTS